MRVRKFEQAGEADETERAFREGVNEVAIAAANAFLTKRN